MICAVDPVALRSEFALTIEALLEGPPVFYLWGGDQAPETGLDCSGLVCWGCRRLSTPLPLGRPNTDVLWERLEQVDSPAPGDLALYGRRDPADPASHVMVLISGGRVAGMSGGGRATQTIEIAKKQKAQLRAYDTHLYRKDFLGWRRLPFHLAPGVTP